MLGAVEHALENPMNIRLAHVHVHVAKKAIAHVVEGEAAVLINILFELCHDIDGHRQWRASRRHAAWAELQHSRSLFCGMIGDVVGFGDFSPVAIAHEGTHDAMFRAHALELALSCGQL